MKEEELRLGNWVLEWIQGFGEIKEKIYVPHKIYKIDNGICDRFNLKPMPVTENILFDCGFEFRDNAYFSPTFNLTSRLKIVGHDGDYCFLLNIGMAIKVKYVHQLQNMFYAITGDELPIDLKTT